MQSELQRKLAWMSFLRVLVVTFLVLSTVLTRESDGAYLQNLRQFLYTIAALTYLITVIYYLFLRIGLTTRQLTILAYSQLSLDVIINGCLVLATGGATSFFTFLFSLVIINAAILLYRRGAIIGASLSCLMYGAIVLIELDILPRPSWVELSEREDLLGSLSSNLVAFIAVALLAGLLSEQLRSTKSKLEQSELSLADLRRLNDLIVSSVQIGLLTVAHDERIIFCNRWTQTLTGYAPEELLYQPLGESFPELAELIDGEILAMLHRDVRLRNQRGEPLLLRVSRFPLSGKGNEAMGWVFTIEDISELKKMQERVQKNERLAGIGQLAAGIAHEIRNPLAAISGSVQMMQHNESLDAAEQRLMAIVVRETDYLNELISGFLAYARPDTTELASIAIGLLVEETVDLFRHAQEGREVEIEVRILNDARVLADATKIKQVLWNLIKNASQAITGRGQIAIIVGDKRGGSDEDTLTVTIEDEGCGVAEEQLPRLFEPFFTTKQDGTGLGLAMVHRIVADHGGWISAENRDKRAGMRFSFTLRLAEGDRGGDSR